MNLEDELKSALKRREPPPGFIGRVVARAGTAPGRSSRSWRDRLGPLFPMRRLQWAAVCATVTVLVVSAGTEYRRRQQGERAKEEVVFALRMAGSRLSFAQRKVLEVSSGRIGQGDPARKPAPGLEER